MSEPGLHSPLRLILITDGLGDLQRIEEIVHSTLRGGVRCVQLREARWTARAMQRACERLQPMLAAQNAWLLANDRVDVAAAGLAHGAQVGHRSLTAERARQVLGPESVLGYSAHDAGELADAAQNGCNFALLSPVWATTSKPNHAFLGPERAGMLTAAARLPVVWLGGVDAARIGEIAGVPAGQRPVGVAVRSALMQADDPEVAAREMLAAWPSDRAPKPGSQD